MNKTKIARLRSTLRTTLAAGAVGFALVGCDSMRDLNPFQERETPLAGTRRPVFPEGVPGVEFGAPPQQPANSNIPISASVPDPDGRAAQTGNPPAGPAESTPPQPAPKQSAQKSAAGKSAKSDPNDAWAGAR